jgi:hypothetical protein
MDREQVTRLFNELGTTADEVAVNLNTKGIKGIPNVGCSCPISNYLAACLHERIHATKYQLLPIDPVTKNADWRSWQIQLPDAVVQFIRNFDRGLYPEMIQQSSQADVDQAVALLEANPSAIDTDTQTNGAE